MASIGDRTGYGMAGDRPTRHFLEIDDVTPTELVAILDASLASREQVLSGRGVALIFEKPSLRTRNSSEMAVVQLGGHPVYIASDEIALDQREKTEDAIRVLEGYFDIICARVFSHLQVERMASVASVPIVNLLSDSGHPVQALADLLTIRSHFGSIEGQRLAWVGDFSNVAMSLSIGFGMLGGSTMLCCPPGYGPTDAHVDRLRLACTSTATVDVVERPTVAVAAATVVSTDAWYSMGQESEKDQRRRAFEGFCVTESLMSTASPEAVFLHCLPAHRGEEVTDAVIDGPRSLVIAQAHNRMHTMRGLFLWLHRQGALR